MDRRVKERLVGASILVVLIVLIVPELLSGPPDPAPAPVSPRLPVSAPEPVRNITVDLATSKAPEPEPPPAEAAASSAQPPEALSAEAASAVAGAAESTGTGTGADAAPPADTQPSGDMRPSDTPASAPWSRPAPPASLETAAPAPISPSAKPAPAGKAWAVQLGSFASRANADKLVRQLKAQGFSVYVVSGGSGPSLRYRVRIGPMADRGTATQAAAKLKSAGQVASLVPPAP
jgi:DedD protein